MCHYGWDKLDAMVVCRQLGLPSDYPLPIGGRGVFGQGSGQIWLRNETCRGSETSLDKCLFPSYPWGRTYGCNHGLDVGVVCTNGS